MLGWMLKRGVSAPEPVADGDNTFADQPDTPAPVFAARAFKSVLFGAPSVPPDNKASATTSLPNDVKETPSKPPGILLTPGTGTTRRKRVSFGRDVGAQPGPDVGKRTSDAIGRNRKRTRLTTALENASRKTSGVHSNEKGADARPADDSDSEWEEEEDEYDSHDVTVDLAEPRSESGKYWKKEFHKYRDDAKIEMDKMLKYKRLAKSYAKLKDAEAMELAEKLRDEQQKVIAMEKKISESASAIVSQQKRPLSDKAVTETVAKLTKQTALVVQYRQRVQELEDQLDEVVRKKEEGETSSDASRHSDNNEATAQRETLQAQHKSRENEELQSQITELKQQLKEARAASSAIPSETSRTRELRGQLREAKEESRQKDAELGKLMKQLESSQAAYEAQLQEMRKLLGQSQSRYADLKKEMTALKAPLASHVTRPRSWHPPATARTDGAPEPTEEDMMNVLDQNSYPRTRAASSSRQQSLRDKFRKDAITAAEVNPAGSAISGRVTLDPASRDPQVRRSPRNKAYDDAEPLGDALKNTISPSRNRQRSIAAPALPSMKHTRSIAAGTNPDGEVDLLKTQFARLGGPDNVGNNSAAVGNTTAKSTLPPERRAAALARLERKRVERQKSKTKPGNDKENVRPIMA